MTSVEFWLRLPPFEYVTTYSFNRGPKLQRLTRTAAALRQSLQQELRTARFMGQRALRQHLQELAQFGQRQDVPLTTADGCFDITASLIARVNRTDEALGLLRAVIMTPVGESLAAGCRPIFRDALVFHDAAGRIVETLNICLQCRYLQNQAGEFVEADPAVYDQLRRVLTALGHPINTVADAQEAAQNADFFSHDVG
ncbi:hypothetical protein LJ737_24180 [Hymenobacter sp. 15J16-1T3B]|uniref:hypothetical protein n=1 Tax=Hymenobacter sp. 15J16-1T3B TaxID=2886941 RepID=UPI001D12F846|nr:hypothetical protein [Hymenobacter sp. 15J16-1T3B]MCC3160356.1 hypothetical protein [Hymenobacter sp. 15J16-1T3B]